jgi:hypothetical protein
MTLVLSADEISVKILVSELILTDLICYILLPHC